MNYKKLEELPYDEEFKAYLAKLELAIVEDYEGFQNGSLKSNPSRAKYYAEQLGKFAAGLCYAPGRNYLKIVEADDERGSASVWGFINLKNKKFKEGDILKANGWRTPALNKARGNIFDENYKVHWTGPGYLSGYSAGGKRNGGIL
tara:strand:+ start:1176 stop:1613 length:438 start_codon:yes stop_codon:yes gene_type:complete